MTKIKIIGIVIFISFFSILCINPIRGTPIAITNQANSMGTISVLSSNNPTGNNWSMFLGNPSHTATTNTTLRFGTNPYWDFSTQGPIYSSPAVVHGFSYFSSWDGNVYCANANSGNWIWNTTINCSLQSSPAVANGRVYIGDLNGHLDCLNATNGDINWSIPIGSGGIDSSPAIANGFVYIGDDLGNIDRLNATNGNVNWSTSLGSNSILSSPAIANGFVYVGDYLGRLDCLNATNGNINWSAPIGSGAIDSSPAIANGFVYIGDGGGNIDCLNATDGNLIWHTNLGIFTIESSPAVANGFVYIGDSNGTLDCLNAIDGNFIWNSTLGLDIYSSPAVSNGLVYIGDSLGRLDCLNASNGEIMSDYYTQNSIYSSPALVNGMVYIGSLDDNLYCLPMGLYSQPFAPLNFFITRGDTNATLNWISQPNNGGWPILGYTIYRGTSSGNEVFLTNVSAATTSYTDMGLTDGQTYYYEISAFNAESEGFLSSEQHVIPATVPNLPMNFQAIAGKNNITLTWQAPSSNGGSPITGYIIYRSTVSGGEILFASIGNVTQYSDMDISKGQSYYYEIGAVNAVGEGQITTETQAMIINYANIGGINLSEIILISFIGIVITVISNKKRLRLTSK